MASTKASPKAPTEERYVVHVSLDTGETHEMPQSYTAQAARMFCAQLLIDGWWWGRFWYPPARLKGVRMETMP